MVAHHTVYPIFYSKVEWQGGRVADQKIQSHKSVVLGHKRVWCWWRAKWLYSTQQAAKMFLLFKDCWQEWQGGGMEALCTVCPIFYSKFEWQGGRVADQKILSHKSVVLGLKRVWCWIRAKSLILHCKLLKCFYFLKAVCKNGRGAGWRHFALCVQLFILNLNGRVAGWQTKNYSHTSQWSVVLGHKRAGVDKWQAALIQNC